MFARFGAFLEQDGRHHVWLASPENMLVYDRHQCIYAYGDLDAYERVLRARGFRPGQAELPVPHTHHYHAQFDDAEDEVMAYWAWRHSPLRDGDE